MVINKTNVKLDKKDHLRALLCDTAPSDTPIIFSNDGLYINAHKYENQGNLQPSYSPINYFYKNIINTKLNINLNDAEKESQKKRQSFPFKYSIIKDQYNLRHISLIHPRAQINYCEFYKNYSSAIILHTTKSTYSIRAPKKVANSFFLYEKEIIAKYKSSDIETIQDELSSKYSSSYFSYSGFNRIHKFFDSKLYFELERKFTTMWMLDVSHCFDSIYTHSVSWALKNKEYIRSSIPNTNHYPQELDTLMQRSNNNETNGIPIGSEFSRVFAELIFQKIDQNIENYLFDEYNLKNHSDYVVLRYVDDYMVFSKSEDIALTITNVVSLKLNEFNLHLNNQKLQKHQRPFCTKKTSIIIKVNELIKNLEGKIYSREGDNKDLNKIRRHHDIKKYFINNTKSICVDSEVDYNSVSSYLISSLSIRIITLIHENSPEKFIEDKDKVKKVKDAIFLLTDLMLFFFSVNPTVSASYKFSKTMVLVKNYLEVLSLDYKYIFMTNLVHTIETLNFGEKENTLLVEGYISIEKINVILSTTFFGDNYLIDESYFKGIIPKKRLDYFSIVSLLFYFRNRSPFNDLKLEIESRVKDILYQDMELLQSSEKSHLFLDILSCPFVSKKTRKELYNRYLKKFETTITRSDQQVDADLEVLLTTFWFVNWNNLDLVKMIERKELKETY